MGTLYPHHLVGFNTNSIVKLLSIIAFTLLTGLSYGQVTRTWNGGGGTNQQWTNSFNWGGAAPVANNLLLFEGTNGLSPLNTFTSGTVFNGLSFGSTAGAFTLSGYPFGLFGNISNNSAQNQVINNNITLSKNDTLSSSGGDLTLNGVISGAFSVTKTGSGLVRLGGQNRFSTRITISDGTLELAGGDSTLAARIPLTVNGGVLDLGSNTQLVGNISGTGGKIKGTGHLIAAYTGANSFAGSIGDNDGLDFTKTGAMQIALDLTGTNTTTGIVTVQGGWISSPNTASNLTSPMGLTLKENGRLGQTSRLNLNGATLRIENSTLMLMDRVNDAAPIHMQGGGLLYRGSSSAGTSETLGSLRLESGQSNISINNPSTSFSSEIIFSELQRTKGAIINLQRMDVSGTRITELGNTGNFPRMLISGTPPVTINGVVPGVFGAERDVMGYVAGSGFGRLGNVAAGFPAYVQYNTNKTLDSTVSAISNILIASTSVDTLTIPAHGITVNTINLRRNDLFFTNDNDVLTLSAGTLMSMGHAEGRLIGTSTVRGVITTPQPELFLISWNNSGGNMTVNSKLTGNMMVVCGGDGGGSLNFTFTNAGNDYTGGTVLNGSAGSGSTLTLNNTDGLVRIPNATNPDSGLVINDRFTVNMTVSQGQIGSANKVTLNGAAALTLFGTNTLAGLKFNVYAAPTVNVGTQLTLTGGINVVHSNPQFTARVTAGTLDLNGDNNFPIHVEGLPSGDPMNFATAISAGLTLESIVANGGISKTGSGVLALTNASNSFIGPITVHAGSVRFNPGGNVSGSSSIVLNGGGISTRSITSGRTLNFSGGLVLNENGTIELSSSATNTIDFGSCSALAWAAGKTLVIRGWAGTAGATGTFGKLFFGNSSAGLTVAQLSQISFEGFNGGAMLLSTGELVPASNGPYEPMIDRIIAGDGRATVYFFNPDNRGSAITNYQYSTDNGLTWFTLSPAVTTSPFTITGLTNGVNYYVRIRAVNANGEGTMSNPETVIPSTGLSLVTYSATALNVTSTGTGSEILSTGTLVEANRFGNGVPDTVMVNGVYFGNSTASMIRPNGPNFQAVWEWNTTSQQTYQTGWGHNSSNSRVAATGWGLTPGTPMHKLMNSSWWMNYSGSRSDLIIPGLTTGNVYRLQLISEAPSDASVYVEDATPYTWSGTNPSVLTMTWVARDQEMFMRLSRKVTDRTSGINTGQGGEVFFNAYVLQNIGVAGSDTTVTACGSFTWQDSTYSASTNTSKTITRVGQPDSIVYLNLTIIPITSNTTTASACDSYTWSVNGTTYTQSGTYSSVSGCHTEILNLTITQSTSNTATISACGSYTWAIDGQTYTSSGTYTSVSGCHTEILALTILTNPTAAITNHSGSTELTCARTAINIEATGGTGYAWSGGLGSNAATSVTSPGTYTVTVTAANGCTGTSSITTTQDITAPNAAITNNTGSTELTCSLTSISLTASGGTSYMWSGGLGSSASATVTMPSSYTVIVTAANGCTDSESITITQDITAPTAVITNNTGSTELTCTRTSISLTASGGVSYSWSNGLGSNASVSISLPGVYAVTVTGSNGCTATQSLSITQNLSTLPASIMPSGPTTFCDGGQVMLFASTAPNILWSTGSTAPLITVNSTGTYALTLTNINGCTSTASINVTVIPNTSNSTTVTDCESYTWSVNGTTYTQTGIYTSVSVCHTETLNLTLEKPRFTVHPSTMSQKSTVGIVLPAYTVAVTGGSGHTFEWYSNTVQSNVGGTLIPGAQSTTYLPPTQTVGTLYYYCKTTTSNGCVSTSNPTGMVQVCGQ